MIDVVRFLAGEAFLGRGLGTIELDRGAQYIAAAFQEAGLSPAGDSGKSYFQTWEETVAGRRVVLKNVIGFIPGKKGDMKGQSLVVGAHYDHLGVGSPGGAAMDQGEIHPGADDNASGIAVLLELARVLGAGLKPDRDVVFVAFTGEEAGKKGRFAKVS